MHGMAVHCKLLKEARSDLIFRNANSSLVPIPHTHETFYNTVNFLRWKHIASTTSKPFYLITAHTQYCQNKRRAVAMEGKGARCQGTVTEILSGITANNSIFTAAGTPVRVPLGQRCVTAEDRLPLAADTEFCLWQHQKLKTSGPFCTVCLYSN